MNAVDFASGGSTISRLEAAKQTFIRFIAGRPDDLIGLVVFANYPDLASPPTLDHAFLTDATRALRSREPTTTARTSAMRSPGRSTRCARRLHGRRCSSS